MTGKPSIDSSIVRTILVDLEEQLLRLLTEDSSSNDRRRRDYNQAIFAPEDEGGYAIFNKTDLEMVMTKFHAAANRTYRELT